MRLPRFRRNRLHEIGEAEAYDRSYGTPSTQVRPVTLPPRRKRYELDVSGEDLRRRFEERLATREEEAS